MSNRLANGVRNQQASKALKPTNIPRLDICREVDKGHETSATRSEDGVALITGGSGGLGGLGITTAEALVEYGVRHLVLCSRSGRVSADAPGQLLQRLEKLKETATVTLEACDASQEDQVVALLEKIREPWWFGG
eukprot:s4213_g8.t1